MTQQLSATEIDLYTAASSRKPRIVQKLVRQNRLSEDELKLVRDVISTTRPVFAPEGGFDAAEIRARLEAGFDAAGAEAAARAFAGALPVHERAARATAAVVRVEDGGRRTLVGTAFLVSRHPPTLVTARHVVAAFSGGRQPALIFGDAFDDATLQPVIAAAVWTHPVWDIGTLTLASGSVPGDPAPLTLAENRRPPGRTVAFAIGYPDAGGDGRRFKALIGKRVLGFGVVEPDPIGGPLQTLLGGGSRSFPVVRHDCSTEEGFSGGPVVDCGTGEVLAVHVHGRRKIRGLRELNIAIPVPDLLTDVGIRQRFGLAVGGVAGGMPQAARADSPAPPGADFESQEANGLARRLNVQADWPDIRDKPYVATLRALPVALMPDPAPTAASVGDQRETPYCVGFALAAAIGRQLGARGAAQGVSPRMLYECARFHDDVPGEAYRGSTIRGGIKGFFHNGAAPDVGEEEFANTWALTEAIAEQARLVQLGSYYRLSRDVDDFHSALVESGSVLASAMIHGGWSSPKDGRIRPRTDFTGAHAFLLVGYDGDGFLVQNSWGAAWGGWQHLPGVAHWSYEDFHRSLLDAWVLRLRVSTPRFASVLLSGRREVAGSGGEPRRSDVAGHFVHLSEGGFVSGGKYDLGGETLAAVSASLTQDRTAPKPKWQRLLLTFHDALLPVETAATRTDFARLALIAAKTYPLGIAWRTALGAAIKPCAAALSGDPGAQGAGESEDDRDRRIERALEPLARALWDAALRDAASMFDDGAAAAAILDLVAAACAGEAPLALDVAADGLGAPLMAGWLCAMARRHPGQIRIANLFLFSPCLALPDWRALVEPRMSGIVADLPVGRVWQWGLDPDRPGPERVGRYRGTPGLLLERALGATAGGGFLGRLDTLAANERAASHRVVEGDALRGDFLDRAGSLREIIRLAGDA